MAFGSFDLRLANTAIDALDKELRSQEKKVRLAGAIALSKTADRAAKAIKAEISAVFDRPTPWAVNSLWVKRATRVDMTASVKIKDGVTVNPGRGGKVGTAAVKFLQPHVDGGPRSAKGHERQLRRMGILGSSEFTVPGAVMRLNRYGNLTGATYSKILADVNNTFTGGNDIAAGFGQRTTRKGKRQYFYSPNIRPRGIYVRKGKRRIAPALLFIKQPTYRRRLDFYGIATKTFDRWIERELESAIYFVRQPKGLK